MIFRPRKNWFRGAGVKHTFNGRTYTKAAKWVSSRRPVITSSRHYKRDVDMAFIQGLIQGGENRDFNSLWDEIRGRFQEDYKGDIQSMLKEQKKLYEKVRKEFL